MAGQPRGAASPSPTPSAFPSDLYGKYKRATGYFLDWLLRARSTGVVGATTSSTTSQTPHKNKTFKSRVALDTYDGIVNAIAREPMTLTPSLLQLWPRALVACETAITLRARVSLFFPPTTDEDKDTHAHFLNRLRSWLALLQQAQKPFVASPTQVKAGDAPLDFTNFYAVLDLPDDYFSASFDENTDDAEQTGASTKSDSASAAERKRLFDETFDNDLNVELSFLFMELEELSEAVYDIFREVKLQKKTLVEATAVAKVAIDCAASVIAKLQLKYPSIRTAQDMMTMIKDRISPTNLRNLLAKVKMAWAFDETPNQGAQSQYVAGTIIADMMWVSRALISFTMSMPAGPVDPGRSLVMRENIDGDTYSEDDTPHYCTPDMAAMPSFLMQQLPYLYDGSRVSRAKKHAKQDTPFSFTNWFLDLSDEFFRSRSASIQFVFLCICWIRSVAALQGDKGLGRTISLSIMHRWDLIERLRKRIAHGKRTRAHSCLVEEMEEAVARWEHGDNGIFVLRANPLLAGCKLLDCHLQFLDIGSESLLLTSQFLGFAHIYNAMRDRNLLPTIPFVEELLQVYASSLFTPSRDAAVKGSFTRTYYVSSSATNAAVDAMMNRRPPPPERLATRTPEHVHLPDLSRIVRLLQNKDFSVLPRGSVATASWKTLLGAVSELCTEELFQTRVLSRDMLQVHSDVSDLFNALCDTLDRRDTANALIAEDASVMPYKQLAIDSALENVVISPLLPFLDCLNTDGTIHVAPDANDMLTLDSARAMIHSAAGRDMMVGYCRRAAAVVAQHFATKRAPAEVEAMYYSFPATPKWRSIQFGDTPLLKKAQLKSSTTQTTFLDLIERMDRSDGPLRGKELEHFKKVIASDPCILAMAAIYSSRDSTGVSTVDTAKTCTVLHKAVMGRVDDQRLVEWLIQMGALRYQAKHCRYPPPPGGRDGDSQRSNDMAIHSAAREGRADIVVLLLEAEHMRDLNTVTYRTHESLAHIAVRNGHRAVYDSLHVRGADMRLKDVAGKYIYEYTSDAAWKRKIMELASYQQHLDDTSPVNVVHDPRLRRASEIAAEQLRQSLQKQRDQERAATLEISARAKPGTVGRGATIASALTAAAARSATGAVVTENTPSVTTGGGASTNKKNKKKKKNKKTRTRTRQWPIAHLQSPTSWRSYF